MEATGGGEVHTGMDGALEVGAEADGAVKGGAGQHGEVGQGGPMGGHYLHVDRERPSSVQTECTAIQVTGHRKAIL